MMHNARQNLGRSWRSYTGLALLLLVGLAIALAAVIAPQTWATPLQSPLAETTTSILPDKEYPDCFAACNEPVIMRTIDNGFGLTTAANVPVYVTENVTWTLGVTDVGTLTVFHTTTVNILSGDFSPDNPALIWDVPLDPGCYDVFFDVNKNGLLDDGDGILNPFGPSPGDPCLGAGICVEECRYVYLPIVFFFLAEEDFYYLPILVRDFGP